MEANTMGIFDKAKEFVQGNPDKVNGAVDKAGDAINDKTGGKHADKIDTAKGKVGDALGNQGGDQGGQPQGGEPGQGGQPGQ
jgi:hypothetical protein